MPRRYMLDNMKKGKGWGQPKVDDRFRVYNRSSEMLGLFSPVSRTRQPPLHHPCKRQVCIWGRWALRKRGDCADVCRLLNTGTPGRGGWLLLRGFQYYDYQWYVEANLPSVAYFILIIIK